MARTSRITFWENAKEKKHKKESESSLLWQSMKRYSRVCTASILFWCPLQDILMIRIVLHYVFMFFHSIPSNIPSQNPPAYDAICSAWSMLSSGTSVAQRFWVILTRDLNDLMAYRIYHFTD